MVLLAVASGLALLVGAVGLYGVVSYMVTQRRREIAIRMAVGAQVGDVRRLVLAEAGGLALVGVALGVGAALALTRQLRAILFETSPLDPGVFVGVSVFLFLVSVCLLASWVPVRRAARVAPVVALRVSPTSVDAGCGFPRIQHALGRKPAGFRRAHCCAYGTCPRSGQGGRVPDEEADSGSTFGVQRPNPSCAAGVRRVQAA